MHAITSNTPSPRPPILDLLDQQDSKLHEVEGVCSFINELAISARDVPADTMNTQSIAATFTWLARSISEARDTTAIRGLVSKSEHITPRCGAAPACGSDQPLRDRLAQILESAMPNDQWTRNFVAHRLAAIEEQIQRLEKLAYSISDPREHRERVLPLLIEVLRALQSVCGRVEHNATRSL